MMAISLLLNNKPRRFFLLENPNNGRGCYEILLIRASDAEK